MIKSRKIFVNLGALLLLGGCFACSTDDDDWTAQAVPQPLTFQISTDGQEWNGTETRGTPLNEFTGEHAIGMLCVKYPVTAAKPITEDSEMFMYNEKVDYDGYSWTTEYGYIVPDASWQMMFYAYYPHYDDITSVITGENVRDTVYVRMSDNTNLLQPGFTYKTPEKAVDQQDLMYSMSTTPAKAQNIQGKLTMQPVALQFHHLLAALDITAKSAISGIITKVEISNVKKKADFDYVDSDGNPQSDWKVIYDERQTVWQDFSIYVGTENNDEPVFVTEEPEVFMLLPQVLGSDNIVTVTLNTGGTETTLKTSFPAGTHLRKGVRSKLEINIASMKRIKLKVTTPGITDWDNYDITGEVSDNTYVYPRSGIDDWIDGGNTLWNPNPGQ
jgi:hypothetical protein